MSAGEEGEKAAAIPSSKTLATSTRASDIKASRDSVPNTAEKRTKTERKYCEISFKLVRLMQSLPLKGDDGDDGDGKSETEERAAKEIIVRRLENEKSLWLASITERDFDQIPKRET
jgi:hypothetical protein